MTGERISVRKRGQQSSTRMEDGRLPELIDASVRCPFAW
jgi:hypothetical protein